MSSSKNGKLSMGLEGRGLSMYLNEKHEADVNYAIQANRWIMKLLGVWPLSYDSESRSERIIARILTLWSTFFLVFFLVTGSLHTFIQEKNVATRIKMIGILGFCVMSSFKYFSLIIKRREIARCIYELVDNWGRFIDKEEREIMYEYALYGRYGVAICACFMWVGGALYYVIMPLLAGHIPEPGTNGTLRAFSCPVYLVFADPQLSPTYELVYTAHMGLFFVTHTTSILGCSLAIVLVVHACSQLKIVAAWLDRLVDCDGKEHSFLEYSFTTRVGLIVDQHVKTLDFISRTDKNLREICLVDVLGSTLIVCLLGFDLLTEWAITGTIALITYACLIISFLLNILVYSYMGEMLTEECQKVGEKTYTIDWYQLPRKTALDLTLTIVTAGKPVTLTAGGLGNLSLTTFCAVLRTSLGYLNILRTLTE